MLSWWRLSERDQPSSTVDSGDENVPGVLLVLWSPEVGLAGRYYALDPAAEAITVGRHVESTIVLDDDAASRRHARFERRADGWWVIDLGSVNGTFVDDEQVQARRLRSRDRVRIGHTIFKVLRHEGDGMIVENFHTTSPIDALTKLYNRRYLMEHLERELQRPEQRLVLVLLDVDRFKRINDEHGHLAGDEVLRGLGALLQRHARPDDVVARYGGEEFVVLMPQTSLEDAAARGDALRTAIAAHEFVVDGRRIPVTVSAGVVEASDEARSNLALIRAAEEQLYAVRRRVADEGRARRGP